MWKRIGSPPVGEEAIARDPEVIIVANSAWATAEDNIAFLQSKPELADITAMQH